MNTAARVRLMVVEDERVVALNLQHCLRSLGYDVPAVAASGAEALTHAERVNPDLVLMDIRIEGEMDGIETAARLNRARRVPVIFLTALSEEATIERARQTNPYGYLLKPFSEREMHATIQMALARRRGELALESTQASLHESEQRFRQLAEAVNEVFFVVSNDDQRILYVSPAYRTLWGRTCESLFADPDSWLEAIHPDDIGRVRSALEERRRTGRFEERYRIRTPEGIQRWIQSRSFPILDDEGNVYRVAGTAQDITERVRLEQALGEREAALRRAQQVAGLAHVITTPDGSFESWSDTLPALLGVGPEEVPRSTRDWVSWMHPEDQDPFRGRASAAGAARIRTDQEYRLRTGSGRWIDIRQVMEPLDDALDSAGRTRWFSTIQDVTEEKTAERQLRESQRRFESMLHNAQLISIMLDNEGRIVYCNDYLLRLTGWRSEEVLGQDWFWLFIPPDAGDARAAFGRLLQDLPSAWHHEDEILTRAGERRVIHWNNSVLRSATGEVIGTASLGEDITERQRAEAEVRRLNADLERRVAERTAELEAANRELAAYDSSVSHDLRAPVRHIVGFGELLVSECAGSLDAESRQYVERMVAASRRMDQIVTDLFALSTMGRGELRRHDVDLTAIAREVLEALLGAQPGRRVASVIAPGLVARSDPGLLKVVMENLLGNAIKFSSGTREAFIEVGAGPSPDGVAPYFVRDNGAGFDAARAESLFAPFSRFHAQSDFPGTGLGLATVRRIVERHGGRVWADSRPGQGATFYFTLAPPVRRTGLS